MTYGCDYEFCFLIEIYHTNELCLYCKNCIRREEIQKELDNNGENQC